MPASEGARGVSNCYVFKSQLQEYAQKYKLPTPVYETVKEGPSHEPFFRSSVTVNSVRYDSLSGFYSRKAAEQSAAEVALQKIAMCNGQMDCLSQPVQETGLCKNMLQEYAQKMNFAIPLYQCRKDESPGRVTRYLCTVEIGGIKYIGASARTKKEAEISAARTALLAIQSSSLESAKTNEIYQLTVRPCRKRTATEPPNQVSEGIKVRKTKKSRFRKKFLKGTANRLCKSRIHTGESESKASESGDIGFASLSTESCQNNCLGESNTIISDTGLTSCHNGVKARLDRTETKVDGDNSKDAMIQNSALGEVNTSSFMTGLSQPFGSVQANASQA